MTRDQIKAGAERYLEARARRTLGVDDPTVADDPPLDARLVGAAFVPGSNALAAILGAGITPAHCSDSDVGAVLAALLDVAAVGIVPDVAAVQRGVMGRTGLDSGATIELLADLLDAGSAVVDADTLAAAVLQAHAERTGRAERDRLRAQLEKAAELAADPDVPAGELVAEVGRLAHRYATASEQAREPALLSCDELLTLPPLTYLVDGIIPTGSLVGLYGAPGAGKSFLALELACDVALGLPFLHYEARQGSVVYVAGEGVAGLGARLRAYMAHRRTTTEPPLHVQPQAVNLLDRADVAGFIARLQARELQPALVILDTLSRCICGGDENSQKDMSLAMDACGRIQRAFGCAVLVVHHAGWNAERERGSTVFRAAVDALWGLKNDGGALRLTAEKVKDAEPPAPLALKLQAAAGSCVVIGTNGGEETAMSPKPHHLTALRCLGTDFLAEGATYSEWRDASGLPRTSFARTRTDLVTMGYVAAPAGGRGGRYALTDTGRQLVGTKSQVGPKSVSGTNGGSVPRSHPPFKGGTVGTKPEPREAA